MARMLAVSMRFRARMLEKLRENDFWNNAPPKRRRRILYFT
jgi:hypothetical protein